MFRIFIFFICLSSIFLSSCGTILKPQQRNQPNSGKIDTTILTLDILGLLLLFPGVIALSVDTINGTIFLPLNAK